MPFIARAGKTFAKKTNAVPPSDMFFAAAIIMTYDALFSNPRHQNDPYNFTEGGEGEGGELVGVCVICIKPSLPRPSVSGSGSGSSAT